MERVKKYFMPERQTVLTDNLFDRVRERLKLTEKQLPDSEIKKVLKLNNKLLGEWVVNNADGFKIKDNGIIIVSKYMPKSLRGEKLEKIQEILDNPKNDNYMKKTFVRRYEKSIAANKAWNKPGKPPHINIETFFYIYRIIWFNSRNCSFKKAELYELLPDKELKAKLNQKIVEGKDYFEWEFSDFRLRKRDKLTPAKRIEQDEKKRIRALEREERGEVGRFDKIEDIQQNKDS